MLASNVVSLTVAPKPLTYAEQVNAKFRNSESNCITLEQRYKEALAAIPTYNQNFMNITRQNAIQEFRRLHANFKSWNDLTLAQSVYVTLADIFIDTTMQRELDLYWVFTLLCKFKTTKVVPIQVYHDLDSNRMCAWDGQHTAMLLYIICVEILGIDPATVKIPVNIFPSAKKAEMRECFTELNSSEGKNTLDDIDLYIQRVLGVRIDNSTNPLWVETEKKQTVLEKYDLFVTNEKFNDTHMPGSISRLQEINKLNPQTLDWLCQYLNIVARTRRVYEKEMMIMAHFFFRCYCERINVDASYINSIAFANMNAFNGDFSPQGLFWTQVKTAFENWCDVSPLGGDKSSFKKEVPHGFPFLLAQLAKSAVGVKLPRNTSNSAFWPDANDLF